MIESTKSAARTFRERDHRYSALPVKSVLKIGMKDQNLKNSDMQNALGYNKPNVIAMMKTGSMRLPVSKTLMVAKMLHIDPIFLLGKVVEENDPELWDVISAVMADQLVTVNEMTLINRVRQELDGHDVNVCDTPGFDDAIVPVLAAAFKRESALAAAALDSVDE